MRLLALVPRTMLALTARLPAPAGPAGAPGRRPAAKPRTAQPAAGPQLRRALCRAAAATAAAGAEALPAWLGSACGVDVGKQAAVPGAGGLVASRDVKPGEAFFAIPKAAWITAETAAASDIGRYLGGCASGCAQEGRARPVQGGLAGCSWLCAMEQQHHRAASHKFRRTDSGDALPRRPLSSRPRRLEPWLALALFLLAERSKGPASRWAPYLAALPADSGSPVQWAEADLAELAGSQALQTAQAYRCARARPQAGCRCCRRGVGPRACLAVLPRCRAHVRGSPGPACPAPALHTGHPSSNPTPITLPRQRLL